LFWSEEKGKFELREPMKRPAFHPSSLRPKFASLLVNLSGVKPGEQFLDPFCGMGGILIEAGLLGAEILGVDFDESALRGATKNLDFYRVKDFDLKQGDSASIDVLWKHNSIDAIATDPPYGRSSHVEAGSITDLYESVLDSAWHLLKHGKRLVIIHPNNIKLNITRAKYDIVARGEWYVHGGLTRKILVLRKL
jgi:tRNA (guanine10-N2)-dimethyltransferase